MFSFLYVTLNVLETTKSSVKKATVFVKNIFVKRYLCIYIHVQACVQMFLSKWNVLWLFCCFSVSMCACMRACACYYVNEIVIYLLCCYSFCEYVCVHAYVQMLLCIWKCVITLLLLPRYVNVIISHYAMCIYVPSHTNASRTT